MSYRYCGFYPTVIDTFDTNGILDGLIILFVMTIKGF